MRAIQESHVGLIALAFSTFVAFSIILGKRYFQAYCAYLGIPYSDVDLNAIEYSIVSLHLTVSVAVFVIWAVVYSFNMEIISLSSDRANLIFGILLASFSSLWIATIVAFPNIAEGIQEPSAIHLPYPIIGVLVGLRLANRWATTKKSGWIKIFHETIKSYAPTLLFLAVFSVALAQFYHAAELGRHQAREDIERGLPAEIFLMNYSLVYDVDCAIDNCDCDYSANSFRVIFVSDQFLYARNMCIDSNKGNSRLFAIPTEDIKHIEYASKAKVE